MKMRAADTQAVFRIMTEAQFPNGLSCPRCGLVIAPGQPFTDQITGMRDGGVMVIELVCVYCGG